MCSSVGLTGGILIEQSHFQLPLEAEIFSGVKQGSLS